MSDFYQDQGAFFVKLLHNKLVPEFVKQASYETEDGISSLPNHAFADPENRKYPIHTKADVYLSAAYFYGKTAEYDEKIENAINVSADIFGIKDDLQPLKKTAQDYSLRSELLNRELESKTKDSISWTLESKTAYFSGNGFPQLKSASLEFSKDFGLYDFHERTEIASGLQTLAKNMGETISELDKFACKSKLDVGHLENQLKARAMMSIHDKSEAADFLSKIGNLADTSYPSIEESIKMAEFINGFDLEHNLTKFYGTKLDHPHSCVFNKDAAKHNEDTLTIKIGNVTHQWIDLKNSPQDIFEKVLGKKVEEPSDLSAIDENQSRMLNQILS